MQSNTATQISTIVAKPILKWAGGKTQMLKELLPKVPSSYGRYIEPFIGGGAMFFALQPENAIIADSNPELINMYRQVAEHVDEVISYLEKYENTMEYFKTQTIRLPFVVDSPRGKEASQESSKEILSMIAGISMLPQVILATIDFNDYKDSLGDSAKNATVITLQKHNRLLDEADYITHEAEIEQLLNLFNVCKE